MLRERHGAGVEPAVDHLRDTVHGAAAFRAGDRDAVHVRAVQFHCCRRGIAALLRQFRAAADAFAVAAGAFPDVEGRAPVAVAGNGPVLDVFQPVAETAGADGFGQPVDGVVVLYQRVLVIAFADVPGVAGVIDQGRVAAPAVRIFVLELRRFIQQAGIFQILQDHHVRLLDEQACVRRFFRHLALAVHELDKRQAVVAADVRVVLAEGRRDVHDAGTVGHGDVIVTRHVERLLLPLLRHEFPREVKQRLVLLVFQFLAGPALPDLRSGVAFLGPDHVQQRFRQDVVLIFRRYVHLHVVFVRVHAERHVGRQRPGGGGPHQEERVVLALHFEAGDGGAFLDQLVALGDFRGGQRRAAARAVGNDLESLV